MVAAVTSHEIIAATRGLTLTYAPSARHLLALVDPDRLSQVLNNLIENALNYTAEGGTVHVTTGRESAEGRVWATVAVRDTGMGIAEDDLPYIFDRFFRGVEPREMQIQGTGLGLAIVKEIVASHGGHVAVESAVGTGSTFTVRVPLANP
jgi:signal transduction histidine kinase